MSIAADLYPDLENEGFFYGPGDYQPIIDYFGTVVLQKDDDGYQGDSRVLYHDGVRYGLLIFGWGSCSGCDALQACESLADVDELIEQLRDGIRQFASAAEALEYFKTKDWELEHAWHAKETQEFVEEAIQILDKEAAK